MAMRGTAQGRLMQYPDKQAISRNSMDHLKKGDFTALAGDYVKYRPGYNAALTATIVNSFAKDATSLSAADVGAGTGIFAKCLLSSGLSRVVAVEPNDAMREAGISDSDPRITWKKGSAEGTGLDAASFDLVSMASSFHWPDTAKALKEFDRILKRSGAFVALWNPRLTERSPVEDEIQKLLVSKYGLKSRVSSGRSGITERLYTILVESGFFASVVYLDAIDVVHRSPEHYVGAWRSVNDIRAELGEAKFVDFIRDVEAIVAGQKSVEVHYQTRAWLARKA
jgi:SAM-dependent methyltransferase